MPCSGKKLEFGKGDYEARPSLADMMKLRGGGWFPFDDLARRHACDIPPRRIWNMHSHPVAAKQFGP